MALISCPNCGGQVSDKAMFCPKCSAALNPSNAQANVQGDFQSSFAAKKGGGKLKKIVIPIAAAVLIIICGILVFKLIPRTVKVTDISVESWNYDDDEEIYTAQVKSSTLEPFIAVVTYQESDNDSDAINDDDTDSDGKLSSDKDSDPDSDAEPEYAPQTFSPERFVYMEDGEGTFTINDYYEPNDTKIESYFSGKLLSADEDFKSINFDFTKYEDDSDTKITEVFFDISFEMKKKQSGLLFFSVNNTLTGELDDVDAVPVINGKAVRHDCYDRVEYKIRNNNMFEVQNLYFVPMISFKQGDVTISKEYYERHVDDGDFDWSETLQYLFNYTLWEAQAEIPDKTDGLFLYTIEQTEGGDANEINKLHYMCSFLSEGYAKISIMKNYSDSEFFKSDKFKDPKYNYVCYGYVPVTKLEK